MRRATTPLLMLQALGLWAALLIFVQPAQAHKLSMFAAVEGTEIKGSAYFSSSPAKHLNVDILGPSGQRLGSVETDDAGNFAWTPTNRCALTLVAETEDGHRADFTIAAEELPESLAPLPGAPQGAAPAPLEVSSMTEAPTGQTADLRRVVEAAVSREIAPLRAQLDRFENRTRFHDVLGGIGYIVGAAGLLALMKGRFVRRKG